MEFAMLFMKTLSCFAVYLSFWTSKYKKVKWTLLFGQVLTPDFQTSDNNLDFL